MRVFFVTFTKTKTTIMIIKNTKWNEEIDVLKSIISDCGLEETTKWNQPCFTFKGKNILLLGAFKDYCVVSFFKGALLTDPDHLFTKPGENTQVVRVIRFHNMDEVKKVSNYLKSLVYEAIDIEQKEIPLPKTEVRQIDIPNELKHAFNQKPTLEKAFKGLTPGRQRGYLLYFTSAKQSKTMEARINKFTERIMTGKGINDCVCGLSRKMPSCDGSHKSISNFKK